MTRVRRLVALLLALAIVLLTMPAPAQPTSAQPPALRAAPDEDVTPLTPPIVPQPTTPVATIEPPPDLSKVAGQPLSAVDVVVDDDRWPDVRPPTVTSMRAGDRLTGAIARRAMEEALASGYFSDARVTFTADGAGVRATVHVMPRKVIDSLRVDMHGAPVDGDELARDAELVTDGELVARDIAKARERIEAQLRRRGYPSPRVTINTRATVDPSRVVVLLDVDAGAPRRIERRVVYRSGGTRVEAETAERAYGAKQGDRADESALETADANLQTRIRARGFLRAEVSHDVVLHRGIVVLRVRIDFGTRYDTRYEGNDHYDKSTLDDVLDLETETDRSPNHLIQKLHDFYVKHGFLDIAMDIEDRGAPTDPVHWLVFHIREGERVAVAGRSYPCLKEDEVKRLSEGGPSSAKGIGSEIDSYLEEELPGNEAFVAPRPSGVDKTIAGPLAEKGSHPTPLELDPDTVYAPETYERAIAHVQELYRSEGYLSAQVGPVQVVRRRCDPRSPPGTCVAMKVPQAPDVCTYDATGLPLSVAPLEQGSTCIPDAAHGIVCEGRVWLRIPVKLGPRTQLYDVSFEGAKALSPSVLAKAADLKLGQWLSTVKIEDARRRVSDAYKEEGYAFVDVKYAIDPSPDRTRARVRFIVAEGEQVIVREIVIRGNKVTNTGAIERRVALKVGEPYRASLVRKTEERIATLGAFSSVQVGLENPFVPQRNKVVVITVIERPRQYTELAPGFSTGEGFRFAAEYGHRNLWGNAVQLTLRLQVSYIPTVFIIDDTARNNYRDLPLVARVALRATAGMVFPEVGLGPLVRTGVDGIVVHDLQRDFYLTKIAAIPNINYRPILPLQFTLFQSFEFNNSRIFQGGSIDAYLKGLAAQGFNTTDLQRQLLVPDGESYVFAQRLLVSWDRRDNAFNATNGTYIVTGIEHVDGFPVSPEHGDATFQAPNESHFFKITQTFGGYVPLPRGMRIAALTRMGANIQITHDSATYPDRLFFLGGSDSMRGWTLNSFIPQDDVDLITRDQNLPDALPGDKSGLSQVPNTNKFTATTKPLHGGNFMLNERIELRIPIRSPVETVVFTDIGNLWSRADYPFIDENGNWRGRIKLPMRADIGTGLRIQTPVGPFAIDYGINITREPYEDFGALNFAIGLF
ncbi:MAG TPA: POTRA domain-containing protein [Labilithrix sp.]